MPVPTGRFKPETVIFREMSLHGSEQLDEQHERTQGYMETVKARQNKECRTVDSAAQRQPQIVISVNILC